MQANDRQAGPRICLTDLYIWAHLLAGAAVLCTTAATWHVGDRRQFFAYLLTAVAAAGVQVRLPGIKGAASVGFLFVFIGVLDLGSDATIVIASASTLVQALWRAKLPEQALRICWNISSIVIAVWASAAAYRWLSL